MTTRAYQRVDSDIVSEASNNDANLSGNGDQRFVLVSSEVSGCFYLWCSVPSLLSYDGNTKGLFGL